MQQVISSQAKPIKMWLDTLEDGAIQQAKNLANLPFTFKHVAIMPDSHQGYGMPIGAVLATEGVIIPNAVGVDIGCGMCAIRSTVRVDQLESINLNKLMTSIQKAVPVGFNHHKTKQSDKLLPDESKFPLPSKGEVLKQLESALYQVGTLGGGNHFIELQKGSDGFIWIMIHSGSRNVGYKTAAHHETIAEAVNRKHYAIVPPSWKLAFLSLDSDEGQDYLMEMNYATEFALANRKHMMTLVQDCLNDSVKGMNVGFDNFINKPHNFAAMENHFGKNVMVHRKGACRVRSGEMGMIPGSMGSKSYIVKGLGNPESFQSCSHGAGRKLSRAAARRELNLGNEKKLLKQLGVLSTMSEEKHLDEAPGAYKNIEDVMNFQTDLVTIEVELSPIITVKG